MLVGLLMELFSEKEWNKNLEDFRHCKSRKFWGEWLVIIGIVAEIFVAGWTAKDEWQTRQMAIKNDPSNLPVSDVSATATIDVAGTNFNEVPVDSLVVDTSLELLEKDIRISTLNLPELIANEVRRYNHIEFASHKVTYHGYVAKFYENPLRIDPNAELGPWPAAPTVKRAMDEIRTLRIYAPFIPKDADVMGGTAEIIINGSFRKKFQIYKQKTDKDMSTWNPDLKGFFLFATNSIP